MKKSLIAFAALLMMFFTTAALAQTNAVAPKIAKRQVNQGKRIAQGVRSGELTKAEAKQLKLQQININRTKRRAKADGTITRKEKAVIRGKQNRASKHIAYKKSNSPNRDRAGSF